MTHLTSIRDSGSLISLSLRIRRHAYDSLVPRVEIARDAIAVIVCRESQSLPFPENEREEGVVPLFCRNLRPIIRRDFDAFRVVFVRHESVAEGNARVCAW